eukprot:TRINITY_DN11840_c0_g1_i1.p1 TRINITY_DN11840_c0_g1~~TRINITY_DN11840_c0_g1_i1.p1  ORF type:complete len:220 (+),score=49.68 TRINITY_DN11840_c0_g1_i1:45-662(+)
MSGNILQYNGGAVIAMSGNNCVAIASDMRYGIQAQTIGFNKPKIYRITDTCLVGLPGLLTDAQTFYQNLKFRVNLYNLKEERTIKPSTFSNMVMSMLYEKRFSPYFIEPIIAGIENGKPYLCGMDLIGAPLFAKDFVLGGSAAEAMYGMAETLWRPDLDDEELFEVVAQCLLSAVDRNAISGWGGIVYILNQDGLVAKTLKGRQD